MAMQVRGEFEVTMTPQEPSPLAGEAGVHRMALDKRYHGELDAVGKGEMLAAHGGVKGSAGYVAMERITGTLQGRAGSFVVQHHGIMDRGEPSLSITVVPDSGTEGLVGISGKMGITITEGKHFYDFSYDLSDAP
ncbi:DUF3224 domain-containing protein [Paludisphaera rhizosphaerae]|uniref:DUF3224 domain-containing protein n=1 Tax=Paludisphaera rhizosphaerae TaxID=2711216 RepID=UPI0013EA31D1|nr:DUF3224 domain-containing protein [Paludisphaera rhizosphaerae]